MTLRLSDRPRPGGGLVRTLRLSRPHRRNAFDTALLDALALAVDEAGSTPAVRALVIEGEGQAFCAGYDLAVPFVSEQGAAPDARVMRTMAAVRACPLPVVAKVQGPAFGAGLELAISCDLRVASTRATFCLPPARLGIAYAPEGLARLLALVGTERARRMAFTGEVVDAERALRMGLVGEVVSPEELDATVQRLADALSDAAPLAVRAMKKTLNALEPVLDPTARAVAEKERIACYRSRDLQEGLAAFADKRAPGFRGD